MKNSFLSLLLLIVFSLLFFSCSSNQDPTKEEPVEYIEIGLSSLLVDYSETPMLSTKAFSDRDIFGVEIHDDNRNYYASWLTSDLSSDVIKLVKNKRYVCYLVYMPNGQDIVNINNDNTLDLPFMPMGYRTVKSPILNGGVFYGDYSIDFCNFGCVLKKGMQSRGYGWNLWNDVDIYYGVTEICSNKDISMTVDLYRMMFGLKVSVENFKEGLVKVANSNTSLSTYVYTLTPSEPTMDKVLELGYMPFNDLIPTPDDIPSSDRMRNWKSSDTFCVTYVTPEGEEFNIYNQQIEVKRLTRYSFTFDLNSFLEVCSSSISANITDEEWSDETL